MKVGMHLPVMVPGLDRSTILEWCRRIDAGPFSSLGAGERINFPNPEIIVTLSAAAAVTERVQIATGVVVLPMHNEVLKAKQLATLDVISDGRLSVGVGAGARSDDYEAVGADFDQPRLTRLAAQVDVMRRIWAGEQVVEGAQRRVEPLPVQPDGPEVLAGSIFPRAIRLVSTWADGLTGFDFGPSVDAVAASFEVARASWAEAERPEPPRLVTSFWFSLGGRDQLDVYLDRYLAFMGPEALRAIKPAVLVDSEARLRNALDDLAAIGTDEVLLTPTTSDPAEADRVAELIA